LLAHELDEGDGGLSRVLRGRSFAGRPRLTDHKTPC
jgi:hypothetical protein